MAVNRYRGQKLSEWIAIALMGAVASSLVAIAVSSVFLGIAIALAAYDVAVNRRKLVFPPFMFWVWMFLALVLVAILFSSDRLASLLYLKKCIRFVYIVLIYNYLRVKHLEKLLPVLLGLGGASATFAVLEFLWLKEVTLLNRVDGFMSHWMTFSGQAMILWTALAAFLLSAFFYGQRLKRQGLEWALQSFLGPAGWVVIGLLSAGLVLSQTRNAWIGAIAGLGVILFAFRKWSVLLLPVLAVGAYLVMPPAYQDRIESSFDLTDTTTQGRLELLRVAGAVIVRNPLTGIGPRTFHKEFHQYRSVETLPDWLYQHTHNNYLQIAVEMGLPALAVWLILWVRIGSDLAGYLKSLHKGSMEYLVVLAGLAVLIAFLMSGLFEYNFGDSEVLTLFFLFITLPYVFLGREAKTP